MREFGSITVEVNKIQRVVAEKDSVQKILNDALKYYNIIDNKITTNERAALWLHSVLAHPRHVKDFTYSQFNIISFHIGHAPYIGWTNNIVIICEHRVGKEHNYKVYRFYRDKTFVGELITTSKNIAEGLEEEATNQLNKLNEISNSSYEYRRNVSSFVNFVETWVDDKDYTRGVDIEYSGIGGEDKREMVREMFKEAEL